MSNHVPNEELSLLAHDKTLFSKERREEIEDHIADCAECAASFDFYSVAESDLDDLAVWQPIAESTVAAMRAYATQCAAEDAEADELLREYFENPRKAATTNVRNQRKFHTGGVVRRLNAKAHDVVASNPLEALIFADLAQAVADVLPINLYPNNAVYELRGTAWKERANALLRCAEFDEALKALSQAEEAFGHLRSSGKGLASVALVRATLYYERGDLKSAREHVDRAEEGYAHLKMDRERMKAVWLRGEIEYEALDYVGAARVFQEVIEYGKRIRDAGWIARGSFCRAACELEHGNLAEAVALYHSALMIFREIGPTEYRIETEWGLARVSLHSGNVREGVRGLRDVMAAFDAIGRVMNVALAGVDLCEALLVLERWDEIGKAAAHAFRVLKKAGNETGALAAFAYLKEAASKREVTPATLAVIRVYLRRVEREPDLLFVPPPSPF